MGCDYWLRELAKKSNAVSYASELETGRSLPKLFVFKCLKDTQAASEKRVSFLSEENANGYVEYLVGINLTEGYALRLNPTAILD